MLNEISYAHIIFCLPFKRSFSGRLAGSAVGSSGQTYLLPVPPGTLSPPV